jgi:hypothetical protein
MIAQSMAREYGPQGIHVAHVVIDGGIDGERLRRALPESVRQRGEDGLLDIDAIADAYWQIHRRQRRPGPTRSICVRSRRGSDRILRQSLFACAILQQNGGRVLWRGAKNGAGDAHGEFHRDDVSLSPRRVPARGSRNGPQSGEPRWLLAKAPSAAASLRAR